MKKYRVLLFLTILCLGLTACGKTEVSEQKTEETAVEEITEETCAHEWTEATLEAPKTCKLCGETEGEPLTCTHDWQEATYQAPKTCLICGETEGEAKQPFFVEHNVAVDAEPTDYDGHVIIYGEKDHNYSYVQDCEFRVQDVQRELQEDGSEELTMVVTVEFDVCFEDDGPDRLMYVWSDAIYDYYTGLEFADGNIEANNLYEFSQAVTIDDTEYVIEYTKENKWWKSDYWYDDHSSNYHTRCTKTIVCHVPEGYDGLVYAFWDRCAVMEDDDEEDEPQEDTYFEPDLSKLENKDGYHLFRMNAEPLISSEDVTEGNVDTYDEETADESEYVALPEPEEGEPVTGPEVDKYLEILKKEIDSSITFEGKEEQLVKLGWQVIKYHDDTQPPSYAMTNANGESVEIYPDICCYTVSDDSANKYYTYQWNYGNVMVFHVDENTQQQHKFLSRQPQIANTCTVEELKKLVDIVREVNELYNKIK